MKKEDIPTIQKGASSEAFTRKWWEDRRSFFARGSGVGKALEGWAANCKKELPKMTGPELAKAKETAGTLKTTLGVAKSKVGSKDAPTILACEAYLKVVEGYDKLIGEEQTKRQKAAEQAEGEVVNAINGLLPKLKEATEKCQQVEKFFEQKSALYQTFLQEAGKMWGETEKGVRLKQIDKEDVDEVSSRMKLFGQWNKDIITPWKEMKTKVENHGLDKSDKVKAALRLGNGFYDTYVDAMGNAQDLGQDHLDLLRRVRDAMNKKVVTKETVLEEINKLFLQLTSEGLGCGSKIADQKKSVREIRAGLEPVHRALADKKPLSGGQIDAVLDLKTQVNQVNAIAFANFRALQRLTEHAKRYAKEHGSTAEFKLPLAKLSMGIQTANKDYEEQQKLHNECAKLFDEAAKLKK